MKKIILLFAVFCMNYTFGQTKPIALQIEVGKGASERSLNNGKYIVTFFKNHDESKVTYRPLRVTQTTEPIAPITADEVFSISSVDYKTIPDYMESIEFKIEPRSKVVVEIDKITKVEVKTDKKDKQEQKIKEFKEEVETISYTFTGIPEKKWVTSFGLAGAYLLESQTYKTIAENGAFRITPDGNQKLIEAIPVVQFTYINLKTDNGFAWTGGLGFDTENLSAFTGGSFYVGHNLLLTAGVAMHKQNRRSNKYANDQIVPEALEFNVLNEQYYRVNPFISLTFVMNKNFLKN